MDFYSIDCPDKGSGWLDVLSGKVVFTMVYLNKVLPKGKTSQRGLIYKGKTTMTKYSQFGFLLTNDENWGIFIYNFSIFSSRESSFAE